MNIHPLILLIHPQLGENIGAVARAMSNFGLHELRLVAPRDGWPNPKAVEMAAHAGEIIHHASVFPDTASAMADVHLAYATTARPRDMEKRVLAPDSALQEVRSACQEKKRVALVFGPERSGLTNQDINRCDAVVTIPTQGNSSLNIAQSAVILGYEWLRSHAVPASAAPPDIAPKGEWDGMFTQLESYLDQVDYWRVPGKKPLMWQNLQTMLRRAALSEQELRTLRGLLRSLWEKRTER